MTKTHAALLFVGAFLVVACAEQMAPSGSPLQSVVPASGGPPSSTGSAVPGLPSASPTHPSPTSVSEPPSGTPRPPAATPTATPTPAPPIGEFPQSWTGSWEDPKTGGSGSLELILTGKGTDFGGSITMDGTACLSGGIISGAYDGRAIEFGVRQRDVEIRFVGTADDEAIAGTFTTDCDGMDGTWTVTRSS